MMKLINTKSKFVLNFLICLLFTIFVLVTCTEKPELPSAGNGPGDTIQPGETTFVQIGNPFESAGGIPFSSPSEVRLSNFAVTTIFVVDTGNGRVVELDRSGNLIKSIAGLDQPVSVGQDSQGNIYIAEKSTGTVKRFTPSGSPSGSFTDSGLGTVSAIALDEQDRIYIMDSQNSIMNEYDNAGNFLFNILEPPASGTAGGFGSVTDGEGFFIGKVINNEVLAYADTGKDRIFVIKVITPTDPSAEPTILAQFLFSSFAGENETDFSAPNDVFISTLLDETISSEPVDIFLIADTGNDRILVFNSSGDEVFEIFKPAIFTQPRSVAAFREPEESLGTVYVVHANQVVRLQGSFEVGEVGG